MLKRFYELYELYGESELRNAVRVGMQQQSHHPEQISRILVLAEEEGPIPNSLQVKDRKIAELHVQSHSLDTYDLF